MLDPLLLAKIFPCLFFAACFIQSGLDKVFDRKGNLSWMEPHFTKSPFRGMVPFLLSLLTLLEVATGLTCLSGAVTLFLGGPPAVPIVAMTLACFTVWSLFAAQRIAKDYVGAAVLASYFAVALIGLALMSVKRAI